MRHDLLQGVFTKQKAVMPRPLTPSFFSDRIAGIDNVTSAAIYHALQGANLLDLHDKLLADPRQVPSPLSPAPQNFAQPSLECSAFTPIFVGKTGARNKRDWERRPGEGHVSWKYSRFYCAECERGTWHVQAERAQVAAGAAGECAGAAGL